MLGAKVASKMLTEKRWWCERVWGGVGLGPRHYSLEGIVALGAKAVRSRAGAAGVALGTHCLNRCRHVRSFVRSFVQQRCTSELPMYPAGVGRQWVIT